MADITDHDITEVPLIRTCPRCRAVLRCDHAYAFAAPWRCACRGCVFYGVSVRLDHRDSRGPRGH